MDMEIFQYLELLPVANNHPPPPPPTMESGPKRQLPGPSKSEKSSKKRKTKRTAGASVAEIADLTNMLSPTEYIDVKLRQSQILEGCVELVTVNEFPYKLLESSGFRKILDPIIGDADDSFPVNKDFIKSLLPLFQSTITNKLRPLLEKKFLSLKVDVAAGVSKILMGVHVQFFDAGKIQIYCLGFRELDSEKTTYHAQTAVAEMLREFKIDPGQICSLIVDTRFKVNDLHVDIQNVTESCQSEFPMDDFYLSPGTKGVKSAAYSLYTTVDDILTLPQVFMLVNEIEYLVRRLQAPSFWEGLEFKKPNLCVPSRWETVFQMFDSLLECKRALITKFPQLRSECVDWECVEDLVSVLRPLYELTMKVESENMTLSDFFGLWVAAKVKLRNMVPSIASRALNAMEDQEMFLVNDDLLACVYLDPRYQVLLNQNEKLRAIGRLEKIWRKIGPSDSSDTLNPSVQNEGDEMEQFMRQIEGQKGSLSPETTPSSIKSLLFSFDNVPRLCSSLSMMDFWERKKNEHPQLYQVAKILMAIPASRLTSERCFSNLKVMSGEKEAMQNEVTMGALFVKENFYL